MAIFLTVCGCQRYSSVNLKTWAEQVKESTVYDVNMIDLKHNYTNDLTGVFAAPFKLSTFKECLPSAKFIKKDMNGALKWKGGSLVVVTFHDGTTKQLAISYYGNFFVVIGQKGYYSFGEKGNLEWAKEYNGILFDDFIPKRRKRNAEQENQRTP